jgi:Cu2+-exporting ATPase
VVPETGISRNDLLALAAAAESHYAHPVARAVVAEAKSRGLALSPAGRVDFIVAHGVSAYVNGRRVLVGSRHFIEEDEGIDCSEVDRSAGTLRKNGKSLLYVARENRLLGVIALRDALRPEAVRVLRDLKAAGIRKIITLTGDHPETARAVAGQLPDLDEIRWDLKPEQKAAIVSDLQKQGHQVAFAGDGVNDAPALITADVGICMPGGADLARESAQVVLLKEDLNDLVAARKMAVQARKIIRTCFNASVGLNSLFLLLAGSGRIPPVLAAVLHNANTVGVLGYAAAAGMQRPVKKKGPGL